MNTVIKTTPIQNIYDKYQIMPLIQLHMLRVAGVAQIICDNCKLIREDDKDTIITSALLHDIGKFVAIKLGAVQAPGWLGGHTLKYWQDLQKQYQEKYGHFENYATYEMVKEIGVSKEVIQVVVSVGFAHAVDNYEKQNIPAMVTTYADQRVSPHGVVSLDERTNKGRELFEKDHNRKSVQEEFIIYKKYLELIEKRIFSLCTITPSDITEENVQSLIEKLRQYQIKIIF